MFPISKWSRQSLGLKSLRGIFHSGEVLNTIFTPFLVAQRKCDQVTSLAFSMQDGNQNVNTWCPVDTDFLEQGSGGRVIHGGLAVLAPFTTIIELYSHTKPWVEGSSLSGEEKSVKAFILLMTLLCLHSSLQFQIWKKKNQSIMQLQLAFQKLWSGSSNLFTDMLHREHVHSHS